MQAEIDEIKTWLLSKCGGPERTKLSALMRIKRIGDAWGLTSCVEHWWCNRHGHVQTLVESWDSKPGHGLLHIKHGRLPRAISEDHAKFFDRMVQDLEVLEKEHFIDQNAVPDSAAAWVAAQKRETEAT